MIKFSVLLQQHVYIYEWVVITFAAFAQNTFPFPSIEIKNKPALKLRAGLSSLGGMGDLFYRGEMFSFVPQCVTCRRLRPQTVQELILQSLNAEPKESVFLTRLGSPRDAALGHWAKTCMRVFDANMLVWPTRTSEYVFCPLPGTSFSGLHIAKAALEADAIIFAPHALPDVDCSESQFMLHMLMGLVKERYSLSIAQQHEDITSHILSLLSTKLLVIDKQMETVCISN